MSSVWFLDGTKGFSPHRLKEKPTGGIITSLTVIPRHLARTGWDVSVISAHEAVEEVDGVKYSQKLPEGVPDIVVFNRNVVNRSLIHYFKASRKIWWLHDIVDHRYLEDDGFLYVNKIIALSHYCVASYSDFYEIARNKFHVIPNGVDTELFHVKQTKRNSALFICASAAIKGFYPLEFAFHNLKRMNPRVELRLYSSQKLHDLDDSARSLTQFEQLRGQGVSVRDPIPQKELADVMREARGLLMPNHYPEICSNLLLQAQACGLPVIGVPIGSTPEFIEHGVTGLMTRTGPSDMFWWWKDYASKCVALMKDDGLYNRISENAPKSPKSWDVIGEQWNDMLKGV